MAKSRFEKGEYYNKIKEAIKKEKTLNIAFPGTVASANDEFPHRKAFKSLSDENKKEAIITFSGIGSKWDDEHPNQRPGNTCSIEPKSHKDFKKQRDALSSISSLEGVGMTSISGADGNLLPKKGGYLFAYGLKSGVELIINLLKTLDKDDALPSSICMGGHSRGSVSCLVLANRIWEEFGPKIKINIACTDPVPGPQQLEDYTKYVIPPNVESLTIVYATAGISDPITFQKKLYEPRIIALDPNLFVVPNPHTKITCIASYNTDHGSITDDSLAKSVMEVAIKGSNNIEEQINIPSYLEYHSNNMQGSGARIKITYYRVQGTCASKTPTPLDGAILSIRGKITDYVEPENSDKPQNLFDGFRYHQTLTSSDRAIYLKNLFDNKLPKDRLNHCAAYEKAMQMRGNILDNSKPSKQAPYICNIGGFLGLFSKEKYITDLQQKCLALINQTATDAWCDPYDQKWEVTMFEIQDLLNQDLEKSEILENNRVDLPIAEDKDVLSRQKMLDQDEYQCFKP